MNQPPGAKTCRPTSLSAVLRLLRAFVAGSVPKKMAAIIYTENGYPF
jgi:hypothetical protein